ncbi:pantoate--beta-alanine ligase [Georgenia sp.]
MTKGALHDGHLALVQAARARAEHVVVSVLVDPLELGEDAAAAYPRDLEADLALLAQEGADLVLIPGADLVPRPGLTLEVVEAAASGRSAGAAARGRPMLATAKLFGLVRPDVVVLGQTDLRRLAAVRLLVRELELGMDVVDVAVRREADGLAASAHNVLLTPAGRRHALALSRALAAGRLAAESGGDAAGVLAAARAVLDAEGAVTLEYLELVDAVTLDTLDADGAGGVEQALLTVAALVAGVRLHDTLRVGR